MRRRARLAAATFTLAVVATGCTPDPRVARPSPSGSPIAWTDCASDARKINSSLPRSLTVECGTVPVPQDWNTAKDGKPTDGKTFEIAVMRIRSNRQTDRIGSILTNFGGPGTAGLEYLPAFIGEVSGLLGRFDLVSFDPRGIGKSNSVKCAADGDLDASMGYEPDPVGNSEFQGSVAISRRIAEGCGAKFGETLGRVSTEQAARDIDAIRAALGEAKLNYLGFSYGTLLGAVYAELFPGNIRAMVLDGAVDPRETPIESSEGQAKGFERAFDNFTNWCKQNPSRCPIAPDARAAVVKAINSARTTPVKGSDGRSATAGWVFAAVLYTLYDEGSWPYLAQAIADLVRGKAQFTFLLADIDRDENGHYGTLFDGFNAVSCIDSDQFPTVEEIRTLQADWRAKYPLFGAPLAMSLVTCALWPAKKDPYPVGPATGAPPIVVVGTTGDPATPYESTADLADMLGTSAIVTWEGEGHTAYPKTTCIRRAVDDYFIDLKVPAKDLRCPAG